MTNGFFITIEGGEGTGKSTLIKSLANWLYGLGHEVLITREPGGTIGAESIRNLLVQGDANRWNSMSEICLFYAAREDHLARKIRPALENNIIVLSDRFFDSTRAYQGALGAREQNVIKVLEENIVGPTMPNLTILLDIDVNIGLARAKSRMDSEGRFEDKKVDFHNNLRRKFLEIAAGEPNRVKIIDAGLDVETVFNNAKSLILEKLDLPNP